MYGLFYKDVEISFGHCDPAGLVFYPNYYRWVDATFHAYLSAQTGGHAEVCRALGARGLGLIQASLTFHTPAFPDDMLRIGIQSIELSEKSFTVTYTAHIKDRLVFDGAEKRGIFIEIDGQMRTKSTEALRNFLAWRDD